MKNEIDIVKVLQIVDKIFKHGEKAEHGYYLDGITAMSDFDGYTVIVKDVSVTLTIYFHNKYDFDYPNAASLEDFNKRMMSIDKLY